MNALIVLGVLAALAILIIAIGVWLGLHAGSILAPCGHFLAQYGSEWMKAFAVLVLVGLAAGVGKALWYRFLAWGDNAHE